MIETERGTSSEFLVGLDREIVPGVWVRQREPEGQFVEIVMPLPEMREVIQECERDFPRYATKLCQVAAKRNSSSFAPGSIFSQELIQGIFNTQILGTVLGKNHFRLQDTLEAFPLLEQAFGLALKGRFRLTAEPLS
jgi:hypothetical protein